MGLYSKGLDKWGQTSVAYVNCDCIILYIIRKIHSRKLVWKPPTVGESRYPQREGARPAGHRAIMTFMSYDKSPLSWMQSSVHTHNTAYRTWFLQQNLQACSKVRRPHSIHVTQCKVCSQPHCANKMRRALDVLTMNTRRHITHSTIQIKEHNVWKQSLRHRIWAVSIARVDLWKQWSPGKALTHTCHAGLKSGVTWNGRAKAVPTASNRLCSSFVLSPWIVSSDGKYGQTAWL